MSTEGRLEVREGYAVFRASGEMPLAEAIQTVTTAIVAARGRNVRRLLLDISGITGFESPSLGQRYLFVKEWAAAAQGAIRIAMVADRRMIDPNKYGVSVAHSLGLSGDVFTTEQAALTWLLASE